MEGVGFNNCRLPAQEAAFSRRPASSPNRRHDARSDGFWEHQPSLHDNGKFGLFIGS